MPQTESIRPDPHEVRQDPERQDNPDSDDTEGSVFADLGRAGQSASRYLSDTLKTLELESRKSALIIAMISAFATAAAVLVTSAWMGVLVFLGFILVREGVSIWLVAAGILVLNLGLAWVAWRFMLELADRISFSASQRRVLMDDDTTTMEVPDAGTD